jgi:hypothetical protein
MTIIKFYIVGNLAGAQAVLTVFDPEPLRCIPVRSAGKLVTKVDLNATRLAVVRLQMRPKLRASTRSI